MMIKRYLIPIIIIFGLISGQLLGCNSVTTSSQKPTTAELKAEVERLQNELNQLKEQKRAEILKHAEAYDAIVKHISTLSPTSQKIRALSNMTSQEIGDALFGSAQFQSQLLTLIEATEDPVLISRTQPQNQGGFLPVIPVTLASIQDYAEAKYKELMAEYNSQ